MRQGNVDGLNLLQGTTQLSSTNAEVGTATVQAFVGTSEVVSTTVQFRDEVAVLSLQAVPTQVQRSSSEVQVFNLNAVARNSEDDPVGGESLNFSSEYGQLDSGGLIVLTNNQGEATDVLCEQ